MHHAGSAQIQWLRLGSLEDIMCADLIFYRQRVPETEQRYSNWYHYCKLCFLFQFYIICVFKSYIRGNKNFLEHRYYNVTRFTISDYNCYILTDKQFLLIGKVHLLQNNILFNSFMFLFSSLRAPSYSCPSCSLVFVGEVDRAAYSMLSKRIGNYRCPGWYSYYANALSYLETKAGPFFPRGVGIEQARISQKLNWALAPHCIFMLKEYAAYHHGTALLSI
jgi:hypothetical protein